MEKVCPRPIFSRSTYEFQHVLEDHREKVEEIEPCGRYGAGIVGKEEATSDTHIKGTLGVSVENEDQADYCPDQPTNVRKVSVNLIKTPRMDYIYSRFHKADFS